VEIFAMKLVRATVWLALILAACDGAAPGTGADLGGAGEGGRCDGVVCHEPPARACEDDSTLRAWDAAGACSDGICVYRTVLIPCAEGCDDKVGACRGDPCAGLTCAAPPAPHCVDATTLRSYAAPGSCTDGRCDYAPRDTTCASGCVNGACAGDACAGVSCTTPPAPSCVDANTRRSYRPTGTCSGGQCSYDAVSMTCAFGCAAGACQGDPCAGVTCTTPPVAYCKDAGTARTFAATGTCAGGGCVYAVTDTPCAFGCVNGACASDPCAGVTCNTPPGKTCVNATTLRTWAPTGTCGGGSCSYASVDVACPGGCANGACGAAVCGSQTCNSPPPTICLTTKRLKTYAPFGTCAAGNTCAYQAIEMDCSTGCLNGACMPGSYVTEYQPEPMLGLPTDYNVRLAVGADNQPRFAACDRTGKLFYREKTLIGWVNADIESGLTNCEKSLAIGPNGEVYLAYYDDVNDDLRLAERAPGATAFVKSVVASVGDVGRDPKVLVSPTGTLMIGYRDGSAYRLATRGSGGGWTTELVSASDLGYRSHLRLMKNGGVGALFGDASKNIAAYNQNPSLSGGKNPGGAWAFGAIEPHGFLGAGGLSRDETGDEWLMWAGNDYPGNARVGIWIFRLGAALPERVTAQLENSLAPVAVADRIGPILKVLTACATFVKQNGTWMPLDAAPSLYPSDVATGPDGRLRVISPGQWQITTIPACTPNCSGRICGDDGCGGTCGSCPNGKTCASAGHACF
jgi:hypothetical protein